jgi:hypothetical protein
LSENNPEIAKSMEALRTEFPTGVKIARNLQLSSSNLPSFSLLLISYEAWNHHVASHENELENIPSTLIINKKTSRFHANEVLSGE